MPRLEALYYHVVYTMWPMCKWMDLRVLLALDLARGF